MCASPPSEATVAVTVTDSASGPVARAATEVVAFEHHGWLGLLLANDLRAGALRDTTGRR
jgi:hypothetical protein